MKAFVAGTKGVFGRRTVQRLLDRRGLAAARPPRVTIPDQDAEHDMRIPNSVHTALPWRIHAITTDFRLEDLWALPTPGDSDDFVRLVHLMAAGDLTRRSSPVVRALFDVRWKLGVLFDWDGPDQGLDARVTTLRDRLPADLRNTVTNPDDQRRQFSGLYLTDNEYAAEIANGTVHAVMHLGWVRDRSGSGYHGQMAVYVKANGCQGTAYMAAIKPIRHLIVYPQLMRTIERAWRTSTPSPSQLRAMT